MRVYKTVSFSVVILLVAVLFAGVLTISAAARTDTMQSYNNARDTGHGFSKYNPLLLERVSEAAGSREVAHWKKISPRASKLHER